MNNNFRISANIQSIFHIPQLWQNLSSSFSSSPTPTHPLRDHSWLEHCIWLLYLSVSFSPEQAFPGFCPPGCCCCRVRSAFWICLSVSAWCRLPCPSIPPLLWCQMKPRGCSGFRNSISSDKASLVTLSSLKVRMTRLVTLSWHLVKTTACTVLI